MITKNCFTCGQDWESKEHHDCPMKGKLDTTEEVVIGALLVAMGCDHYCCDLSPAACQAKVITHYLRDQEMLREVGDSAALSVARTDFCKVCGIPRYIHDHPAFIGDHGWLSPNTGAEAAPSQPQPAKCPVCEATGEDQASKICNPSEGSCPMSEKPFLEGWPTQAEFDTHQVEQIRIADAQVEATPSVQPEPRK